MTIFTVAPLSCDAVLHRLVSLQGTIAIFGAEIDAWFRLRGAAGL